MNENNTHNFPLVPQNRKKISIREERGWCVSGAEEGVGGVCMMLMMLIYLIPGENKHI
jgi:hypothetical protein